MIDIDDPTLNKLIRESLLADPEGTAKVIKLMVRGAEIIDEFEKQIAFARAAPMTPDLYAPEEFEEAIDKARNCFGDMIDNFGDLLAIATKA